MKVENKTEPFFGIVRYHWQKLWNHVKVEAKIKVKIDFGLRTAYCQLA